MKANQAPDGFIWDMDFGDAFATEIECFIGADPIEEPDEWQRAWEVNCEWGERIADNVNDLLLGEDDE